MLKFSHFDPRSGEFVESNPTLCSFGILEVAVPALIAAGSAVASGVGAAGAAIGSGLGALGSGIGAGWTAGGLTGALSGGLTAAGVPAGVAGVAAPVLEKAGIGAGLGALTGNPGTGALLGGISGGLGPLSQALGGGAAAGTAAGALAPGMSQMDDGSLVPAAGYSQMDDGSMAKNLAPGGGSLVSTQGQHVPTGTPGAGQSPLAAFASKVGGGSGLSSIGSLMASLIANADRPPTSLPQSPTQNMPWNPSGGVFNRQPVQNYAPAAGTNYYTYGSAPQPQFYTGNQYHFAHGGALSHAMAAGQYASGGALNHEFSTGGGENLVRGPGDGTSDSQPAALSDGEYVLTAQDVARIGQGSTDAGAKKLDEMRKQLAKDAGAKQFQPKVKPPLAYLDRAA